MSIQTRLILALSAFALALVLGVVLLFQWRFDSGLLDYVNAQQEKRLEAFALVLAESWREDPGWLAFTADPRSFYRLLRRTTEDDSEQPRREHERHERRKHHDETPPPPPIPPLPVVLLDADHRILIGRSAVTGEFAIEVPILVDGERVGYLATPRFARLEQDIDRHFREDQLRALWLVAAFALLFAVVVAVLLARQFTRPLRQLSQAAHRLTQQQYDVALDTGRRDELGALARDISELARTLDSNAHARHRWFADISHELRTPLAVLSGEIDAMLDGVRPLNRERIESLRQETGHLLRLVEDLYVLARADLGALQYRKADVDLASLVHERTENAASLLRQAQLRSGVHTPDHAVLVHGDEDRLQQLIDNLLSNSARYTDAGGEVRLTLSVQGSSAELVVEDSAPGVPEASLPRLFDHLYRVDEARTRAAGGAGLGLAICKRIVEAHDGSIEASAGELGGLRIRVRLPLAATRPAA
ncbi:MAG: ATP-binding protein [Pseudomonadota bacterium]